MRAHSHEIADTQPPVRHRPRPPGPPAQRAHMLNAAPFMCAPLPIIIPIYRWWEVPYMWAGAKAYDLVAGWASAVPGS